MICLFLQNFVAIGWSVAELLQVFDFQNGGRPPSWIFKICKFSPFALIVVMICFFKQNFVAIGWTVAEILQVLISKMAAVRHLGFLKYENFYISHGLRSLSACPCKISSRSDDCIIGLIHVVGECWLTSYQLSHAYDRLLADCHIKTRKNWVPASSVEDLVIRSKHQNKVLKFWLWYTERPASRH